jgi:hypothetical protein
MGGMIVLTPDAVKAADAVLDFPVDWSKWLIREGNDTLLSSSWSLKSGDAVIGTADHAPMMSRNKTIVWLSEGTVGTSAVLVNHIITVAGREESAQLTVSITT